RARLTDPGEYGLVCGVIGALPARASHVSQSGRAQRVRSTLTRGAARLAEEEARFGLSQVHDLEGRVVVDHKLLAREAPRGISLGNPEDRVIGVTAGTRVGIFPGLVE